MHKNTQRIRLVLAGALLFSVLFWKENLGLNFLLYDIFLLAGLLYLYPDARKNTPVKWLLLMQTICAGMVVQLHTGLSIFTLIVLLPLLAAFAAYVHRSIPFAGASMLLNSVLVLETLYYEAGQLGKSRRKNKLGNLFMIGFIPLLIALVFFLFYVISNNVLASLSGKLFSGIGRLLAPIFSSSLIDRFFFLLLGLYLTAWLLTRSTSNYFAHMDAKARDGLERIRKTRSRLSAKKDTHREIHTGSTFFPLIMGLKKEFIMGVISLVLLNVLLLVENGIDITYVWFNYGETRGLNFSREVHNGTELLIFSILCAMMVLLLFFKGNLNFYKRNKWLKILAYCWIIQNMVLACSLLIRDQYYIVHFGLYYKRIGVLFFLAMVLGGLISMYIKIRYRKTVHHLVRINAWIMAGLLVVATTVSWDNMIVRYNIRHTPAGWVDWDYLLNLSNTTIPELASGPAITKFKQSIARSDYEYTRIDLPTYVASLATREEEFIRQQQNRSWLSWNWADHNLIQYFSMHRQLSGK